MPTVDYGFFANPDPDGDAVFSGGIPVAQFGVEGKEDWDDWTAKIGLDYQLDADNMLYGFVSQGFKSGGFVGRIVIPQDIGPYDQEVVKTAEVGIKSEWSPDSAPFTINFWATNLLDDRDVDAVFDAPGFIGLISYGPPRQAGVSVEYAFD